MNWYHFKRRVLSPYIRYKRYRERHQVGFIKSALELHYYRPVFYRFMDATLKNPDIMYEAPLKEGDVVLDVGAYIGDWSARVHEKYQPRLYLFEPDQPSLRRLQARFGNNPDIRCFSYGLADRDADLRFVQRGMGSTFYAGDGDDSDEDDVVKMPVRDVCGVLDELGHEDIDLMKLNIEGGEYDVLERMMETDRLASVRCYMIQFHEWLDGAHRRRRRIRRALRRSHRLVWDYPFVWEQWVRKE